MRFAGIVVVYEAFYLDRLCVDVSYALFLLLT